MFTRKRSKQTASASLLKRTVASGCEHEDGSTALPALIKMKKVKNQSFARQPELQARMD